MAATRATRTLLSLAMVVAGVTWLTTTAVTAGHNDRGLVQELLGEVSEEIADETNDTDQNGGVDNDVNYSGPLDDSGSGYSGALDERGSGYSGPLDEPGSGYSDPLDD